MNLKDFLLDLLFPRECVSCQMDGAYLCTDCAYKISPIPQSCPVCGQESFYGTNCSLRCAGQTYVDQLLNTSSYKNSVLAQSIHTLKYRFSRELASALAVPLINTFIRYLSRQQTIITPVPLHPRRMRQRGFNQSALLAYQLASAVQRPFTQELQRIRHTKPQQALSQNQRRKNLIGAFSLAETTPLGNHIPFQSFLTQNRLMPEHVTLIDDVYTTGSTVNECAKVLKRAGVKWITVLVLARTNRP